MTEAHMTLAVDWKGQNLCGWLMTEKYDGCRAFWDGKQFWTRAGNKIPAARAWRSALPAVPLDGEIWAGRGGFQTASNAVRNGNFTEACRFVVFDAPGATGTWSQRIKKASQVADELPFVTVIRHEVVRSGSQVSEMLSAVTRGGGEGLMFRSPTATGYETGRSKNLLRLKP